MIFTVISKDAPMYGQGPKLGDDWYEVLSVDAQSATGPNAGLNIDNTPGTSANKATRAMSKSPRSSR